MGGHLNEAMSQLYICQYLFLSITLLKSQVQTRRQMQQSQKKIIQQLSQAVNNCKESLFFSRHNYQTAVLKIIPQLQILNIQNLFLNSLHLQKVLEPFLHIQFQSLLTLDLSYNFIISVQFLVKLNAPRLTYLRMQDNHITETKALRKCHFPDLQRLRIQNNHLKVLKLSQCNFPELRELDIANQGICEQDLMKVSSKQIIFVRMQHNQRKKSIVRILKSIFEDIEVAFAFESAPQDLEQEIESHETDN